jgi:hypothetical protein
MKIVTLEAASMNSNSEIIVRNDKAFLLTQWLEHGVFSALECENLYKMTFAIYSKHPVSGVDILLETYQFKITYSEDNMAQINGTPLTSTEDVKSQAGKFIRSLVMFTQSLDNLPDENWITIELKVS